MLFDDLPGISGPPHSESIEDMQSIADLVAVRTNELEPV
jgi:hypothetical protein